MLNLNNGFNLNVIDKVDRRRAKVIRSVGSSSRGISVLTYKKKQNVPSILVEVNSGTKNSYCLRFEHLDSNEVFTLFNMIQELLNDFLNNKDLQDDVFNFFDELLDLHNDSKPVLDAPKDKDLKDIEELSQKELEDFLSWISSQTQADVFVVTDGEGNDIDESEGKEEYDDDVRFTADFFDFCHKDKDHFFRLLQTVDYLCILKDASSKEIRQMNYLAFVSLCFKYDSIKGTKENPTHVVEVIHKIHRMSEDVLKGITGEVSICQTIQALMESMAGYKARNWTEEDVAAVDEMLDDIENVQRLSTGIKIVLDDSGIQNRDRFMVWVQETGLVETIADIHTHYSGVIVAKDLQDYAEQRNPAWFSADDFVQFCIDNFKETNLSKHIE